MGIIKAHKALEQTENVLYCNSQKNHTFYGLFRILPSSLWIFIFTSFYSGKISIKWKFRDLKNCCFGLYLIFILIRQINDDDFTQKDSLLSVSAWNFKIIYYNKVPKVAILKYISSGLGRDSLFSNQMHSDLFPKRVCLCLTVTPSIGFENKSRIFWNSTSC